MYVPNASARTHATCFSDVEKGMWKGQVVKHQRAQDSACNDKIKSNCLDEQERNQV